MSSAISSTFDATPYIMSKTNLLLSFFACLFLSGQVLAQEQDSIKLEIFQVVRDFTMSIAEKDSVKFMKLFFEKDVAFTGVMTKETEWSIKKDYPEFQGLAVSNAHRFISEICSSEKYQNEKIYDLAIEVNGPVATVKFDYAFEAGYKLFQWGHERWNLVFVEEQWLITDVVYSIKFPDVEPMPERPSR